MMKSDSGREILELVLKNVVPKISNNKLKHDRHQITSELRMNNNRSFKKLCAQAEDIRHTLQFLKEHIGLHKSLLRFLEIFSALLIIRSLCAKFCINFVFASANMKTPADACLNSKVRSYR